MESKLISGKTAFALLLLAGGLFGCSDTGPNDPSYSPAELKKMRDSAKKPTDGPDRAAGLPNGTGKGK